MHSLKALTFQLGGQAFVLRGITLYNFCFFSLIAFASFSAFASFASVV